MPKINPPNIILKDYYYFLGVKTNATPDDIRKAYRKLSLKYHPDRNENDVFFEERFKDLTIAYETLIDEDKRKAYDYNFQAHHRHHTNFLFLPPSIQAFSTNKRRIKSGDELIITWQTNNADVVKILPFGLVESYGEKKIKITKFDKHQFRILLHATNSHLHKTVVREIVITELQDINSNEFDEKTRFGGNKANENLGKNANHWKSKNQDRIISKKTISLIIFLLILAIIWSGIFYLLFKK